MIKYIDLFAGIGSFRQVFTEERGFKCIFSSEINKATQETYIQNYNNIPFGDINQLNINELDDFDLLFAGIPCQPFSVCGLRKGFDDIRGTLFFNIAEIIKIKKPQTVIIENVKGLVHHNSGNTLSRMINILEDMNYNLSYDILNSSNFELPQNRERVFIVATINKLFDFSTIKINKSKPLKYFL